MAPFTEALVEIAGSIPDGGQWNIHSHNPSGRTTVLGLTQYWEYFLWVKVAGAYG